MLMNGKNRVSVDDLPIGRIIVPPPLTERALRFTDSFRAMQSRLARCRLAENLPELGHTVNGIDLVGKAANPSAQHPRKTRVLGQVTEIAVVTLVLLQNHVCAERKIIQIR